MWANWEVVAFVEWLRAYNQALPADRKVGFYGLDVYSLWDSMRSMITYLEREDPEAAESVRKAVLCFEPFNENEQLYARYTLKDQGCREEVLALLKEIRVRLQFMDGDREAGLNAEQNALIAVNAEAYYRSMIRFDQESWNVRDRHMMETLDRLLEFHGRDAKGIVWAHNTHVGDARATPMRKAGMVNIGELAREKWGAGQVYLLGFSAYTGTVIAGEEWGAPMEVMNMPEGRTGSIEAVLEEESSANGYLLFDEEKDTRYEQPLPHRAIGVVYDPATERYGNYVPSVLSRRYDALLFFKKTKALHPLHLYPDKRKLPGTYPFSL